jgi:hypothetical protein
MAARERIYVRLDDAVRQAKRKVHHLSMDPMGNAQNQVSAMSEFDRLALEFFQSSHSHRAVHPLSSSHLFRPAERVAPRLWAL